MYSSPSLLLIDNLFVLLLIDEICIGEFRESCWDMAENRNWEDVEIPRAIARVPQTGSDGTGSGWYGDTLRAMAERHL